MILRLVLLLTIGSSAFAAPRPNVLLILADDLGFSDLGCYGGEIRTPCLDALADNGLRFSNFYNSARCCPSRASLLTGLYPHQAGVGEMTSDRGDKFPGYRGRLNENCVTIAQVLKPAGYATAASGKWHVGDTVSPIERGFDDFYGFTRGYGVNSWDQGMMLRLPVPEPEKAKESFFATDAITDHALEYLQKMRGTKQPWFMYLAYQAPHFPLASKAEDMSGYPEIYVKGWDVIREERLQRMNRLGLFASAAELSPRSKIPQAKQAELHGSMTDDGNNPAWDSLNADRRADLAMRMAVYAGMVTGMDRNIGRVVEDLRSNGELDDTLIIFLSDNGACAEWDPFGFDMDGLVATKEAGTGISMNTRAIPNVLHQGEALKTMNKSLVSFGSGWANACNTPLRLYKHYVHEGGISTPFIAHWPAGIEGKGRFVTTPAHLVDVMATCADLAGAAYPKAPIPPMEGVSLVPLLQGKSINNRILYFEHENNAAVRAGDWKLVRTGRDGTWELYHITGDRVEMHDVASDHVEMVGALAKQWDAWAKRCKVLPR